MLHLKIAGVPEHFNLPWHQGLISKRFEQIGIKLKWVVCKGGTGEMNAALRDNSIDLAIMLTEGIVYDIIKGNPSKIIGQYVESPLQWGIYTGINNPLQSSDDIFSRKIAISRLGSGSHLMPLIDASKRGIEIADSQMIIVRNLEGALQSLANLETDVFYWERFTTQPFVDKNLLRQIGMSPTPWPCFVMVARNNIIEKHLVLLQQMIEVVLEIAKEFKNNPESVALICKRHHLSAEDAKKWMGETHWSADGKVHAATIQSVIGALQSAQLIPKGDIELSTLVI